MSYLKTIYILLPNCSLRSYLWYICCDLLARSPAMRTSCISVDATLNTPIDAIVVVRFVTSTNCATLTRGERLGRSVEGKAASSQYLGPIFNCESRSNWPSEHVKRQFIIYYFESCQLSVIYKVVVSIGGSFFSCLPKTHSPFDFVINCFILQQNKI